MPTPANTPTKPYKAVAGFALTFLATLLASVQGRPTLDGMGVVDWLIVAGGALVSAGVVWGVTNPPTTSTGEAPEHRAEGGHVDVGTVVALLVIVLLVVLVLFVAGALTPGR